MSRFSKVCRGLVVLYLAFSVTFTFFQIYRAVDWPSTWGMITRLLILLVVGWGILVKPKYWSVGLGLWLVVESAATSVKLLSVAHHPPLPFFVVSGLFVSRTTVVRLFCIAPAAGAIVCFALNRSLRRRDATTSAPGGCLKN
jgi:hypothetical protein